MLNLVAVQVGNYCDRGSEYARNLFDGLWRNLRGVDYRAYCISDDPTTLPNHVERIKPQEGVSGWWHKIALFKPGQFRGRCLYLDLDTLILGDLTQLAAYSGPFAALRDPYFPQHLNSAMMAWEAGAMDHIWTRWEAGGKPQFDRRGDQFWIETMQPDVDYWQEMFPGQIVSFKAHCRKLGKIPDDARICLFHGKPRPHEVEDAWIAKRWRA
jgi:hypothetical protein